MMQYEQMVSPYLFETLQSFIGHKIIVQLANGEVSEGTLSAVLPQYILLSMQTSPLFIRIEHIVWITRQ